MRRHIDRWQVIVLVDQSGSMADSVIHAAVTASIFTSLNTLLRTHLAVFDTNVVDLTDTAADPVETLMKVQLGGGTDIGHALRWAEGIIDRPDRAIVVLISDFIEGAGLERPAGGRQAAGGQRRDPAGAGGAGQPRRARLRPRDRRDGSSRLGAHVAAMTPHELAEWVAAKVK